MKPHIHVHVSNRRRPTRDATNHLGEREYQTYAAWRTAARAAGAVRFEGDKDIASAIDANGKHVGEWVGDKGSIYKTKDAALTLVFNVAEVEHGGDEENSIADLRRAGCSNIQVVSRNWDSGYIRVSCTPPAGVSTKQQLESKLSYAILDASSLEMLRAQWMRLFRQIENAKATGKPYRQLETEWDAMGKKIDKLVAEEKTTKDVEGLETYRGFHITWEPGRGKYKVTGTLKGQAYNNHADSVKEARAEIDRQLGTKDAELLAPGDMLVNPQGEKAVITEKRSIKGVTNFKIRGVWVPETQVGNSEEKTKPWRRWLGRFADATLDGSPARSSQPDAKGKRDWFDGLVEYLTPRSRHWLQQRYKLGVASEDDFIKHVRWSLGLQDATKIKFGPITKTHDAVAKDPTGKEIEVGDWKEGERYYTPKLNKAGFASQTFINNLYHADLVKRKLIYRSKEEAIAITNRMLKASGQPLIGDSAVKVGRHVVHFHAKDADPNSARYKLEKEYTDLEKETEKLSNERDAIDDRLADGLGTKAEQAKMNVRITEIDRRLTVVVNRKSELRRQLGVTGPLTRSRDGTPEAENLRQYGESKGLKGIKVSYIPAGGYEIAWAGEESRARTFASAKQQINQIARLHYGDSR